MVPREQIPRFLFQIHTEEEAIAVSFKCDISHSNLCYYGSKLHVLAREIGRADKEDSWDLLSYLYFTHMLIHFPPTPLFQDPGWLSSTPRCFAYSGAALLCVLAEPHESRLETKLCIYLFSTCLR